jgi:phosphoglycolate phosphatase
VSSLDYDFWLLDLDGTLVDIEPAYIRSVFDGIGDRLGCRFTDREAEAIWYDLAGAGDAALAAHDIDRTRFWEVFHEVEEPLARAESTYLYADAAFIAAIDEPVGLVTHCQRYLTEPVLDSLDIVDWFDTVVCCDEETGWKPDPTPLRLAIDELEVAGGNGVLAGDGPHDVGAAWNADLDAVHVERHGHERRGGCVLGDYRVERLSDLPIAAPSRARHSPLGRRAGR